MFRKLHVFIEIFHVAPQPLQAGADTGGETSNQNEVPTVTVAMPFMQVDMLGHSGASTAAVQAATNRMVI